MSLFNKNLVSLKTKPLEQRHNTTRINKKLDKKVISTINDICREALQSLIKCKQENKFTKHQRNLFEKFCKNFVNTRASTLSYKLTMLKQDLKSKSRKLKCKKRLASRKSLNKKIYNKSKTHSPLNEGIKHHSH